MNRTQIIAALAITAWVAYSIGRKGMRATAAQPVKAVATVDAAAWDWLNAVGSM